ncbi:helix-turn-helix transcriptional regulator [Nocardioides ultimimeridianus]
MDLLERGTAIDDLLALGSAAGEGRGAAACVVALAGMGKSSVLDVARNRLARQGLRVLAARASELEQPLPYAVIRSLLDSALADPAQRAAVLTDAAAPVATLLDGGTPTGGLQHATYWTLANLAREAPLALLVDDAHWSDDASLEALAYVARRLADLPVLIVVAARPRSQARWPSGLAGLHAVASEVALAPLSAEGVGELVAARVGWPAEGLAAACHRATGGVPFYVDQLLSEILRRGPDLLHAHLAVADAAPDDLVRSVLARLAAVGEQATTVARAVAVLGDGTRLDHVARLAGVDLDVVAATADALATAAVLRGDGTGLGFAHPILRSAVLGDLGRHERSRWHDRAARVLAEAGATQALVATQLVHTEPTGDPWICGVLLGAGRDAMAAGSPGAAIDLLRRGLAEPPPPELLDEHLFALGIAEATLGDIAALDHLNASLAGADDALVRADRALAMAELARKAGLAPIGIAALDAALMLLPADSAKATLAAMERHWIARTTVPTVAGSRADRPVLDRGFAHPDPDVRRRAAVYLALEATLDGTAEDVDRYLTEALAPPGLVAAVDLDAGVLPAALYTLTTVERHEDFERLSGEMLAEAGRTGNGVGYALATVYRGTELLRLGRLADAELEVVAAMDWATEAGWPKGSPELVAVHVQCLLLRGDLDAAERALEESPFPLEPAETAPIALLVDARGQAALARGDLHAALADFRSAGSCLDALGLVNPGYLAWRSHVAEVLRLTGDVPGALAAAEEELALARRLSGPAARSGALRQLAAALDRPRALAILEEAAATVAGSPAVLERARVAAAIGGVLRRSGQAAAAVERLKDALDLATRCGATVLADEVHAELLAAGARPRRVHLTGPDSLTAAERRVVRLAAGGLTNTVIAQTLFVSRKTVEKHLANAYAKLGVCSRKELAGIELDPS